MKVIDMNKSEYVVWSARFEPRPVCTFLSSAPFSWFCLSSLIILSIISPHSSIAYGYEWSMGERLAKFKNIRINSSENIVGAYT